MANLPNKINKSSSAKRFIKLDIDVTSIDKSWFYVTQGRDGSKPKVFLKATLMMLPDGETDRFGNLGMIIQDVPMEVHKVDKTKKGNILGNACELEWSSGSSEEAILVKPEAIDEIADDLPF